MNIPPSKHDFPQHDATRPRHVFLTFGDRRLGKTLRRIRREAEEMGAFDEIRVWDERDLSPAFRARWADMLRSTVRGFGYWVWKPEIILRTLDDMQEGEILLYADAGCKLVKTGRARLEDYFRMTEETPLGIVATLLPEVFPDRDWCKGDLMDYLGVRNRPDILDSAQIQSGTLFIRKNPNSIAFLKRWAALWDTDFALIDDSPSRTPNAPTFREHRHDQAAFSLLAKLEGGIKTIPMVECYPEACLPEGGPDWSTMNPSMPIWHCRDKCFRPPFRSRAIRLLSRLMPIRSLRRKLRERGRAIARKDIKPW